MKAGFVVLAALLIGLSGTPVHAQTAEIGQDPLMVSISPDFPRPYEAVTISPQSNLIDLSASTVSVSVNGVLIEKGSGTAPVQIQAGAAGVRTVVTVTAVNNGQTYTKEITIRPADVALIVEPVSVNHPFYRGASLVSSEGLLRLVALPDLRTTSGAPIPASSLVYTWRNGSQVLQDNSGIGKSVLTATAPVRYRDTTIRVTVATQDSSIVAEATAFISPTVPVIRIYQNDPLLGPLFNYALPAKITMTSEEQTFRAVPYYFSGIPLMNWTVNGNQSQSGKDITVRSSGSGTGTALVGFNAKQTASGVIANSSLNINFGEKKSLGIFGL
ncbi:MAG: hypothetical protein AB203_03885 [Parcubacteria bacterium C7867-008]|nr:MAG: hypothetical protein AB203_03885 [Parcubacteria bacterium C7867-008]